MHHVFYRIKLREVDKWYYCEQYGIGWGWKQADGTWIDPKHIFRFSSNQFSSWKTKSKAIEHVHEMFKTKPELQGHLYLQKCSIGKVENVGF